MRPVLQNRASEASRVALAVRGTDYEYPGDVDTGLERIEGTFSGVGPFRHDDPRDRPIETFGGEVTIHAGSDYPSNVLLPIMPEDKS